MLTSYPAGTRTCQACSSDEQPAVGVDDGSGELVICDECREPYEQAGATTAAAADQAYTASLGCLRDRERFEGELAKRVQRAYGIDLHDGDQRLAFDVELLEQRRAERDLERAQWRERKRRQLERQAA